MVRIVLPSAAAIMADGLDSARAAKREDALLLLVCSERAIKYYYINNFTVQQLFGPLNTVREILLYLLRRVCSAKKYYTPDGFAPSRIKSETPRIGTVQHFNRRDSICETHFECWTVCPAKPHAYTTNNVYDL